MKKKGSVKEKGSITFGVSIYFSDHLGLCTEGAKYE